MSFITFWRAVKPVVVHVWPHVEAIVCQGIKELGRVVAAL